MNRPPFDLDPPPRRITRAVERANARDAARREKIERFAHALRTPGAGLLLGATIGGFVVATAISAAKGWN